MRKVYNVSYDLRKSDKDYMGLHNALKATYEWNHLLGSTWLLYTSETVEQIMARLKPHIDENDRILVIQVVNNYNGWLPETDWQWLRARINKVTA